MTQTTAGASGPPVSATPSAPIIINQLTTQDLVNALAAGWHDFKRAPQFGLFFGLLYAAGGWAVVLLAGVSGYFFLAYPLAAGFALIAPFIAAGLYEVSRQLESRERTDWMTIISGVREAGGRDLGWMALVTGFSFFIWLDIAVFIYAMFFGVKVPDFWIFIQSLFTTPHGLLFLLTGHLVGAVIALFVFSITVVSFPLLLDRNIDFVTAMMTSVRCVKQNKRVMLIWAITIALLLVISFATALAALIFILPWTGHATWHLYRSVIAASNT